MGRSPVATLIQPVSVLEQISIDKIVADPDNVRSDVGDVSGLAASIKELGVLQALLVEPVGDGTYKLIAGERRWTAAKQAGLGDVPCMVREGMAGAERLEAQLVENLRREDIVPLDEAVGYRRLVELGLTQHQIADKVGCTQAHVSKRLRLLELTKKAKDALAKGRDNGGISVTDAYELTRLVDHPKRLDAALREHLEDVKVAVQYHRTLPSIIRVVDAEVAAEEREQARTTAIAELTAAGVKIVEGPPRGSWYNASVKPLAADDSYYGVKVAPTKHAKEPCHAAVVDERGKVFRVCTNPSSHGLSGAPTGTSSTGLTPAEKRQRAETIAANKARRSAEKARAEAMRAQLAARIVRSAVVDHVLYQRLAHVRPGPNASKIACELLDLEGVKRQWGGADFDTPLATYAGGGADQLARANLALAFAVVEERIRDANRWQLDDNIRRHFTFLEHHGYELSSFERERLK